MMKNFLRKKRKKNSSNGTDWKLMRLYLNFTLIYVKYLFKLSKV